MWKSYDTFPFKLELTAFKKTETFTMYIKILQINIPQEKDIDPASTYNSKWQSVLLTRPRLGLDLVLEHRDSLVDIRTPRSYSESKYTTFI